MRKILILLSFILFLSAGVRITSAVTLEECEKDPSSNLGDCINIFSGKIGELGTQKKTLSSQITQFDTQIKVTQLKITDAQNTLAQLEREIGVLGFRIEYVTDSIDKLEMLVKERIVATYQQSFVSNLELIVASDGFSDVLLKLQYLKQVQENDKKILASLQETKSNYANQKEERETKQAAIEEQKTKLEKLKVDIDRQKAEKQTFLEITKNDESRYQKLLAQAQAERAIVFGGGSDVFMRDVKQGDSIGSIASHSASPGCSSGSHLHFEVHKDGSLQDPNNYLRSGASYSYSYPDSQYGTYGSINPHGDLPWPLNETVTIHQGYGSHSFAQAFYSNGVHAGIDMDSGSSTVKAVKDGKLYGGSYNCSNGKLYYAKVVHGDGLTTWYLHMIPN